MVFSRFNRKGEESSNFSKIIAVILVIIVIVVVLLFIFRADLKEYLRNLPGYQINKVDTVIDNIPEGIDGVSLYGCQVKVADIVTNNGLTTRISFNGKDSMLKFDEKDFIDWSAIELDTSWWRFDKKVASLRYLRNKDGSEDKRAKIIEGIVKTGNAEVDSYLDKLNGKFVLAKQNVVCDIKK